MKKLWCMFILFLPVMASMSGDPFEWESITPEIIERYQLFKACNEAENICLQDKYDFQKALKKHISASVTELVLNLEQVSGVIHNEVELNIFNNRPSSWESLKMNDDNHTLHLLAFINCRRINKSECDNHLQEFLEEYAEFFLAWQMPD